MTSNSIPLIEGQTYTFLIETDIGGVGTTQHNPASTTDGIFYYDIPGYVGSFDFSDIVYLMETNSDPVITNVTSTNTDGTYTLGDVVDVIVTFNEVVNVNTSGGLPELLLETGIIDQSASYISGTGTNQLTFRYNVQNGDSTTDLDYASNFALNLNGASIKDIENNDAVLSLPVTGTPGSLGANHDIVINCNITLSAIVQSNVLCNGGSDGSIDLTVSGGIAPYNYIWSNSATTEDMAGLFSGTYNVVVTDANGCTANTSVTVTEPTMLTASAMVSSSYNGQDLACNGASNGEATVSASGGTMGYTYQWDDPMNQTTAVATGLVAGTYNVVVTDANGCTASNSVTINEPATITTSIISMNVSCNGGSNGTVDLTVTGGTAPYTFMWSNSATTEDMVGLSSGTYNVVVTDANGCTATDNVTINEPATITTSIISTDVPCNGSNNGTVDLTVSGGTAPYTFIWSNSATTEDMVGLSPGTYNVVVTDANGCTATDNVTINEPAGIITSITSTDVSCNGLTNGTVDLTVSGGTAPYSYVWSNSATTEDMVGLSSGIYNIVVTDANGCTAADSVTINEPELILNEVTQDDGILAATEAGMIYQWYACPDTLLTGETNQTYTPTTNGEYKVVISNIEGCSVVSDCVTVASLGLSDTQNSNVKLTLFPNPAKYELYVKGLKISTSFEIIDLYGKKIRKGIVDSNTSILVDKLPVGMYFLKLDGEKVIKFIKK